ncbi:LacI family DNA-binding transcriptional regulator [Caulobacter segnis]
MTERTKGASIKDVAEYAGVSPKTVSRVHNGERWVREEVREKVLAAIKALNYRPNAAARSLSGSRSYLLGLVLDNPSSHYAGDVQLGALKRARLRGCHLVVEPVDIKAASWTTELTASITALRLDGVLLTPPLCDNAEVLKVLDDLDIPYVRISPDRDPERSPFVHIDERGAAHEMTTYLLDRGHTDIGFILGQATHSSARLRFEGFRDALAERGLTPREAWIVDGNFQFPSGQDAARALLSGDERPTAIFAANDAMAFGAIVAASKQGLSVPGDLSVVGFDDAPAAQIYSPGLTTIRQPVIEMGALAVDLLLTPPGDEEARGGRCLAHGLIERDSVAPLAGRGSA